MRLTDGRVRPGTRILLMSNGRTYDVQQVGVFSPDMRPVEELSAGQVGYITASIKRVADAKVGETITETARPTAAPFPGYRDAKPMVFAGLYSIEDTDYEALRDALEKLRLNDPAFTYEPETSLALGYGFRCGFLGMLHMEIVQERLEREFDLSLIVTAPSVQFKVLTTAGEVLDIDNPSKLPTPDRIEQMDEPYVQVLDLRADRVHDRDLQAGPGQARRAPLARVPGKRVHIRFDFPLSEIVVDFYDRLKSISKGYASFDYEFVGVPAVRPGEARHPAQRRPGRRAVAASCTATRPTSGARRWWRSCGRSSRASSSRSPSRRRSAAASSPGRRSRPWARTSPPSATAATSRASASSSSARRKARSG